MYVLLVAFVVHATPVSESNLWNHSRAVETAPALHDPWRANAGITAPDVPGPLVINEIHYAPTDSDAEFIEILNRSTQVVELEHVTYADANGDFDQVVSQPRDLAPGEFLVIARNLSAFTVAFPEADLSVVSVPGGWEGLNNGGDEVVLRIEGVDSDRVQYDASWGEPGRSLERKDPDAPSQSFNFEASRTTGTPAARNTRYGPDTRPPVPRFAEILGSSAFPDTATAASTILFDEVLASSSVRPEAFSVAGARVRSASLSAEGQGVELGLQRSTPSWTDLGDGRPTVTVRGVKDRSGNEVADTSIAIALPPTEATLALSEIHFDPLDDPFDGRPDQTEYVEIVNTSTITRSLRGMSLRGGIDENGSADILAAIDTALTLDPQQRATLFAADPYARSHSTLIPGFQEAYPASTQSGGHWIPIRSSSLRLTNSGRTVRMVSPSFKTIDSTTYSPRWHSPDLAETDGVSLERISLNASSTRADNWTSSAHPDGGTPGLTNSIRLSSSVQGPSATLDIEPSPFSIGRDGATRIRYSLSRPASSLRIRIYDAHGRRVRTITDARRSGPEGEVIWNGRDDVGKALRIGVYVVLFEAVDLRGHTVTVVKRPVVIGGDI